VAKSTIFVPSARGWSASVQPITVLKTLWSYPVHICREDYNRLKKSLNHYIIRLTHGLIVFIKSFNYIIFY
jgi:hypothetical protein